MAFSVFTWVVCFGFTTTLIESSEHLAYEPKYHYPVVRNKQFDFPTYSPVALLSSAATPVCLPALKINVRKNAVLRVTNIARVAFNPDKSNKDVATLTGGPVFNDKYIFQTMRYGCDGVPNNTRAFNTLDGVGYPAQFLLVFYKELYKSFDNAMNYRDGLISLVFPMIVEGNEDNPLFTPVEKVLYQVRKQNSTALIDAKEAFYWLLKIFHKDKTYYVYPGGYLSSEGKFYFNTNEIVPSFDKFTWISYRQFMVFEKVLNIFNQPSFYARIVQPLGRRPLVEAVKSPVYVKYGTAKFC